MKFRLYYDTGGLKVDGKSEAEWNAAPTDGVLFANIWHGNGKVETLGLTDTPDYYVFHEGKFYTTQDLGPLLRKLGFIKFGRWTTDMLYSMLRDSVKREAIEEARSSAAHDLRTITDVT